MNAGRFDGARLGRRRRGKLRRDAGGANAREGQSLGDRRVARQGVSDDGALDALHRFGSGEDRPSRRRVRRGLLFSIVAHSGLLGPRQIW
jgi:hypothetical protein